jgi:methanogenic corrinoid protein MtbC1
VHPASFTAESNERVRRFLELAAAREVRAARELVLEYLAESGDDMVALIQQLLAPAMVETGARWYDGRWNAAQEHLASGLTDGVLSAASVRLRRGRPPVGAPSVVLACPRGEDHLLAARFAGELFAELGVDVITLGPPLPDPDLHAFLAAVRPDALVVSCTWPLALHGVRDLVVVAHRAGVPVLVGGAALGADDRRAEAIGADGWAPELADSLPLLRAWSARRPNTLASPRPNTEAEALRRLPSSVLEDAVIQLPEQQRELLTYDAEPAYLLPNVRQVVGALSTANLVEDDKVFLDFVDWARGLLTQRGYDDRSVRARLTAVETALAAGYPHARRLLEAVG